MQVSDGPRHMQMSQTQQIHMRNPHSMGLSQQQSYPGNMATNGMGPNQYMTEQMQAEMRKRQQQQTMLERQAQVQHRSSDSMHSQQYGMGRPPPEYKMQPPSSGTPEGYSSNGVGSNPLQTMQNMVNQTNSLPNPAYTQIKTESAGVPHGYNPIKTENPAGVPMHNSMMQNAQMSNLQRMNSTGGMPNVSQPTGTSNYAGQSQVQRQQSYPGTAPTGQSVPEVRQGGRPSGPAYTSAIMRNQRPPNVNVGPDGLNISQPRSQHEWPRQMSGMPVQGQYSSAHQGMAAGMTRGGGMTAGMMQYGSYSNVPAGGMNSANGVQHMRQMRPMQMSAMQSQAAMMQGAPQSQQQMMMQQSMHMSQRMGGHGGQIPPGSAPGMRSGPVPGMSNMGPNYGGQQPGAAEDIMNLLDSHQANNSEFIPGMNQQNMDASGDWLDGLDDFLK